MKKLLVSWILIFFMSPQFIIGQSSKLDSIIQAVETMPYDSDRVNILIQLSVYFYSGSTAKKYAYEALSVAHQIKNDSLVGEAYAQLSEVFYMDLQLDSFNYFFEKAEVYFDRFNNHSGIAYLYRMRAQIFQKFQQEQIALENFQKSEYHCLLIQDDLQLIHLYNNWGIFHYKLKQHKKAEILYEKSFNLILKHTPDNNVVLGRIYFNMGRNYQGMKRYNKSLPFLKKAYIYRKRANLVGGIGESRNQFILLGLDMLKKEQEIELYNQSIQELGYENMAALLDSLEYLAFHNNHLGMQEYYYETSYQYHEYFKDYKSAFFSYKSLKNLTDSLLLSKENIEEVADLQLRYNNEVLENQLLQSKIVETQRTSQRNLSIVFLLATLLLSAISFMYYQQSLNVKKVELALEAQKFQDLKKQQQIIAMNAMLDGQEKERERISKDLHDGLGNLLSSLKHQIASFVLSFDDTVSPFREKTEDMIDEACSEVRRIAHAMMPQALKELGLSQALEDLCKKQNELHSYEVIYQSFGSKIELEESISIMLFRIAQEAFNNINKHADAKEVIVQLTFGDNWINLTFEDDGKGFDPTIISEEKGLGLHSIQSRVTYLSGECLIESQPDKGTSISINIPT